jgi:hypothetical protein
MRVREALARHGYPTDNADKLVATLGKKIAEEDGSN